MNNCDFNLSRTHRLESKCSLFRCHMTRFKVLNKKKITHTRVPCRAVHCTATPTPPIRIRAYTCVNNTASIAAFCSVHNSVALLLPPTVSGGGTLAERTPHRLWSCQSYGNILCSSLYASYISPALQRANRL